MLQLNYLNNIKIKNMTIKRQSHIGTQRNFGIKYALMR